MNKIRVILLTLIVVGASLLIFSGMPSAQGKEDLKAPNGLSFADIKGYETWQIVAPSYRTDKKEIRYILGNTTIINAYKSGIPANNKPFPEGSVLVKISYSERVSSAFSAAIEPDVLQRIEFMLRDSNRFKETNGWGYARFIYEPKTDTFKAYGKDPSFATECSQCHMLVKERNHVFTQYPRR